MTVLAMFLDGGLFGSGLSGMGGLLIPIVFFVGLYFLMIVPNQRKQKAWAEMLGGLKAGDRVTTSGGLRGTVVQVKDEIVVLRVQPDNLKLEFVKSAISAVTTPEDKA